MEQRWVSIGLGPLQEESVQLRRWRVYQDSSEQTLRSESRENANPSAEHGLFRLTYLHTKALITEKLLQFFTRSRKSSEKPSNALEFCLTSLPSDAFWFFSWRASRWALHSTFRRQRPWMHLWGHQIKQNGLISTWRIQEGQELSVLPLIKSI